MALSEGLIINGTSGDDNITGGVNNDTLKGLGGKDTINGGNGNDNIQGGDGNDTLYGEGDNDTITGGAGVDVIYGGDGDDTITDNGDSTIYGGSGDDTIYGNQRDGNEEIGLKIHGGDGNDLIQGVYISTVDAGAGDDTVRVAWDRGVYGTDNSSTSLIGGSGYDILDFSYYGFGTFQSSYYDSDPNHNMLIDFSVVSEFEEIVLLADSTYAYNFTDNVGQAGSTLKIRYSAAGWHTTTDLSSETDAQIDIDLTTTNRLIGGVYGNATVKGGGLGDTIKAQSGNDIIFGNGGDDTIDLGAGDDTVTGGSGNDTINGGLGTDIAIFSGNKSDYTFEYKTVGLVETITVTGTDGTDTVSNIETLRFDDGDMDVRPAGRTIKDTGQAKFAPIEGKNLAGETLTAGSLLDDPDEINDATANITYY